MKIGIFDSGLGGLFVTKEIIKKMPNYDYIYLGDTANLPYGTRSQKQIYELTKKSVSYLFNQGCAIVILACNTASSQALRKLQRVFLPRYFPDRAILGVIIPSAEAALGGSASWDKKPRVGIIATPATVKSKTYVKEIKLLSPKAKVYQQATPLLVPMIESSGSKETQPALKAYLRGLLSKKIDTIILGCTHYGILKSQVRGIVGPKIKIISQNEVVPGKLKDYLQRHREITVRLTKKRRAKFLVTKLNKDSIRVGRAAFGKPIKISYVRT